MSPAFPARRRAEQFDALVEGTATTPSDAAMGELLELVGALRTAPRVQARPDFVLDLRERLMVAAETELSGARTARQVKAQQVRAPRTSRERRLATALGGFALVGATASMAVAAQHALPGDQLYPLKRTLENAHTGLSIGNDAKGSTLLANAKDRLDEVDALTHEKHANPALISQTLNSFTDQASQASNYLMDAYAEDNDKGAVLELAAFTATSHDTLTDLVGDVPPEAQDALATASRTIDKIQTAAVQACPACAAVLPHVQADAAHLPPLPGGPTVLAGPVAPTVPSLPTDSQPAAPATTASDSPTLTPTAPIIVAPTATASTEPSDGPTNAQPPTLFPTSPPSSSAPSSGGSGNDGGQSLPSAIVSALGHGGTASNPQGGGAPVDLPSVVQSAVTGITGLLSGGSPSSGSSSSSTPSSSPSPSAHPTKHHTKHHHHGQKDPKADTGKDQADTPAGSLDDLLGE